MLSQEALNDFKRRYKEEFGIGLDEKTATEKALKLLVLFKAIKHPIPLTSPFLKRKEVKSEQPEPTTENEY